MTDLELRGEMAEAKARCLLAGQAIATLRRFAAETLEYWDEDEFYDVGMRLSAMSGDLKGYDRDVDAALELSSEERAGNTGA